MVKKKLQAPFTKAQVCDSDIYYQQETYFDDIWWQMMQILNATEILQIKKMLGKVKS